MPSGLHQLELDIPIHRIWNFVKDMDKWAPLIPGYIEHQKINDRQSTWKFRGDVGVVHKNVSLRVDITKWQEPTNVTFKLKGISENFVGGGYFEAEALSSSRTKMTGYLDITAKGMMGPVINKVLKSLAPKTTRLLCTAIADKIVEGEKRSVRAY
jgi:carbon monoxide dehydrogenase subunit G